MDNFIADVSKGGEDKIRVEFNRVRKSSQPGICIRVIVKVHPDVEDFMRDLGDSNTLKVSEYGRLWSPLSPETPLFAYDLLHPLGSIPLKSGDAYTLDGPIGSPLLDGVGRGGGRLINISPLRLFGSSQGEGASFYLKGVYSESQMRQLQDLYTEACKHFYLSYLRPINVSMTVITCQQEFLPSPSLSTLNIEGALG